MFDRTLKTTLATAIALAVIAGSAAPLQAAIICQKVNKKGEIKKIQLQPGPSCTGNGFALTADLSGQLSTLQTGATALRTELKNDVAALKTELKNDVAALRSELENDVAGLEIDTGELSSNLAALEEVVGGSRRILQIVDEPMDDVQTEELTGDNSYFDLSDQVPVLTVSPEVVGSDLLVTFRADVALKSVVGHGDPFLTASIVLVDQNGVRRAAQTVSATNASGPPFTIRFPVGLEATVPADEEMTFHIELFVRGGTLAAVESTQSDALDGPTGGPGIFRAIEIAE